MTSPRRDAPLEMPPETFRAIGHALVDRIAELMRTIPAGPVTHDESPSAVRAALDLDGPLPESGADPARLISEAADRLAAHSLFNAHPRFFGYITAPPAPIGVLGDFLASALNPNVGAWMLAPAATEVEAQTVRWIAQLIGFPETAGGLLVSGGNMANFVCVLAARTAGATWNVRTEGLAGDHPRIAIYASAETHTWIQKAADLFGFGTDAIRWIPTDDDLRMDVGALDRRIADDRTRGVLPLVVIGTAGSVSTGAIDPLPQIADLCEAQGLWFHVDGAYGGFAAAAADAPADLRALSRADSVAIDPHKWLYAPLEAGCALVRDPERLREAFAYYPPYYHFEERATNFVDYGMQNSRGFRALKVWLGLRQAGASGYRRMIGDDIALAGALADAVRRTPELEWTTTSLSITTFRFVPEDLRPAVGREDIEAYLNKLNAALLDRLQRNGEAFVSNAVIRGRYVLRACIVNFHTEAGDIEALPGIVVRTGHEVDAALRAAGELSSADARR